MVVMRYVLAALTAALLSTSVAAQSLPQPNATYMPQVLTQAAGNNSSLAASTAYVDRSAALLQIALSGKAPLVNPAFMGQATFSARPSFAGATPWDSGNLNPSTLAPIASPQFSGAVTADSVKILGAGSTGDISAMTVGGTALSSALGGKAPLASPTFSGSVTAPSLAITGTGSTGLISDMSAFSFGSGIPRAMKDFLSNEVYAADYGVVPNDGLDDGPAMRQALAVAQQRRARLRLPGGIINVCTDANDPDALLRITGVIELAGASRGTTIIPCATAGTRAVILLKPLTNGGGIRGAIIRDLTIGVLGGTRSGGDGIRADTSNTNGFIARLTVENVAIANAGVGLYSFRHYNDPAANFTGGLFASTVRDNEFFGGVKFEQTGDSNNIERNTITGPNPSVDYGAISGAATHRIVGNNLTGAGGGVILRGGAQVKILENQIEQTVAYTGPYANPASIIVDGTADWIVRDNNINGYTYADAVSALNNARGGTVGPNSINFNDATHYLYRAVNSPGNVIERQRMEIAAGVSIVGSSKVLLDAASPTFGVWNPLALANGWLAGSDASYRQGLFFMPLADGTIRLAGTIRDGVMTAGTTIATLPLGFRTVMAQRVAVPSFTGTNPWQIGMINVLATGDLKIQNMPGNSIVQFDSTSFSIRN